jgi:MFS family permease
VWTVICLATVGAGNAVLDVAGFTLIQRGTDDAVLARVFGVFEVLVIAALGVGSIIGSLLVDQFGVRVALVVAGSAITGNSTSAREIENVIRSRLTESTVAA